MSTTALPAADVKATHADGHAPHHSFWLWVMCLTGVDYFSTLGYQPSIAFEETGRLAPIATVMLVLLTLLGALPVYSYVAGQSYRGQGSIAMLERLVHGWTGKFLVLLLLGFAATDFIITKTLSTADAATHLIHNPIWEDRAPPWLHSQMTITVFLLVLLGATFLRGFREVIGVAVVLVGVFLLLNAIVILSGLVYIAFHPVLVQEWFGHVQSGRWELSHEAPLSGSGWLTILGVCFILFPKLALGLSGFETGVAVMPLVRGEPDDDPQRPMGRIQNTRKLLLTAAVIMSAFLLGAAIVTTMLIQPQHLKSGGRAFERALAYLAHQEDPTKMINPIFGDVFGTIYDISTIAILWFAGASAMSGLLNLVPQYLPGYGMAPEWARAIRPLVVLFTLVNLLVTWVFDADVKAQAGAYATGVMVLISSACLATVFDITKKRTGLWITRVPWHYVLIAGVFVYMTTDIIVAKPDGIKIAGAFIIAVVLSSMTSRILRSTELRLVRLEFVDDYSKFLWDTLRHLEFPVLVPHRPGRRSLELKEEDIRREHRLDADVPIVFVEAELGDTSQFMHTPLVSILQEQGRFIIRVTRSASIAHVIATLALELSKVGKPPEVHFGWSDESPLAANLRFVLFGEGNVPWLVHELIGKAEPNPDRRPRVVIG
jgi:hypothetical protein